MLVTEQDRLREEIGAWIEEFGNNRGALLPTLQELHKRYGKVSDFAMQAAADRLGIHPVEVYSVVSFYSFLNHETRGQFVIRLCGTLSCEMQGKEAVAQQLRNELGIDFGETTADSRFTLEWASCLGMCDQGPAMLVNERVYTKVTPEKVRDILKNCKRAFSSYAFDKKEEF
jgi:NADH:ubiquinone oxidoreductase subunit E